MDKVQAVKERPPLWALKEDMQGRVSQELALDLGWRDWRRYESWAEYPDGRSAEGGLQARREWAGRKEALLAGQVEAERPLPCSVCGEPHLTASNRWHDQESRQADLERMAAANHMTVTEVEARLELKTPDKTPDIAKLRTKTPDRLDVESSLVVASVCGHQAQKPKRGPAPQFCSDACRKAVSRRRP